MKVEASYIVPFPPRELMPNARAHHMAVAKAKGKYRETCAWLARVSIGRFSTLTKDAPEIHVDATIVRKDRRGKMDDDNSVRLLKTALDGLQDATGINDRKFRVSIPQQKVGKVKNPEIRIFLWAEV